MPLSDDQVARAARDLYRARRWGVPIDPLTGRHPGMDLADGYRVQQELVALLTADGDRVAGYKLGLTSAPMQALMGVDSPDFAPVLASHLRPDGATVTAGSFIAPKVEAEIALVLRDGLAGPDCTEQDVAAAVSGAVAALGGPLTAVAWLVRTLHPLGGALQAGQFVMTGALHAAVSLAPGQRYRAEFDRLGAVELTCQ
jgi:2-keto-4-pentenoate hydratase